MQDHSMHADKSDPIKADPHHKHSEMQNSCYDQHSGHHNEGFLKRFWVCLVLTIPVLLLSHMIQQWLGFIIAFEGDQHVLLTLGSIIFFYDGYPFLVGLVREVKSKNIGMMTLVAISRNLHHGNNAQLKTMATKIVNAQVMEIQEISDWLITKRR